MQSNYLLSSIIFWSPHRNHHLVSGMLIFIFINVLSLSLCAAYTSEQLNSCDNHEWTFLFGDNLNLDYGFYQGANCLRITVPTASNGYGGFAIGGFANLANGLFSPEDWTDVTKVEFDIFIEGSTPRGMELEIRDATSEIYRPRIDGIAAGFWQPLTFNTDVVEMNAATAIQRIIIIFNSLDSGTVIYLKNMRLVKNGQTIAWDAFSAPSYEWEPVTGDYVLWDGVVRNEPITNSITADNSAGALYLPWDADLGGSEAKIESKNMQGITELSNIDQFKYKVFSDNSTIPIKMGFWDGSSFGSSMEQSVATANQWETVIVDPPSGVNLSNIANMSFHANTSTLGGQSGHIFIDELEFVVFTPTTTITFTPTVTPTITPSASITPSPTISLTSTQSATLTSTLTFTPSSTISATYTATPSISYTPTQSATFTITPTTTPSATVTATPTISSSITMTATISTTPTLSPTKTKTKTTTMQISAQDEIRLSHNSFNPLKQQTLTIAVNLPKSGKINIVIYNRLGHRIKQLVNTDFAAGRHQFNWDGRNQNQEIVGSGVYLIAIATDVKVTKKIVAIIK